MIRVEISSGIIVEHPTGVLYTNQTGGYSTNHPEKEGFLIPFDHDISHVGCWGVWTQEDLDTLDTDLTWLHLHRDKERWEYAEEAWVPVILNGNWKDSDGSGNLGLVGKKAWLTWENCD